MLARPANAGNATGFREARETRMQALEVIRRGIAENTDIDPAGILPEQRLDEIGIDSFTLLELIFTLEEEMNIELGNDVGTPETVQDLIDILAPYLAGNGGG